jgi:hypothetical protein
MDDELDPVTRAAIQRLRFLLEDAERELNDATVKTKVLRHALFEVEGTAHQEAERERKNLEAKRG